MSSTSTADRQIDLSRRPSSQIRRCVVDGVPVYEKQYLPDDWGGTPQVVRQRAQREIHLLQILRESERFHDELGLVHVERSCADDAIIVTREVDGSSLDQWIHDPRGIGSEPLQDAMFAAGRWVQRFQSIPLEHDLTPQISNLDPSALEEYCELRLSSLSEYGYEGIDDSTRSGILRHIRALEDARATEREVWVHADYAPGNLIWDGTTLTPIDFAMVHSGHRLDDVTYFIHRLEMQRIYRPWRRWPLCAWREAFLEGYGDPDAWNSPQYQLLMVKHLICRLHTYVRRPAKNQKQALHDRWVRYVLRRKLNMIARDGSN